MLCFLLSRGFWLLLLRPCLSWEARVLEVASVGSMVAQFGASVEGKFFAFGGKDAGSCKKAWKFDDDGWSEVASMPLPSYVKSLSGCGAASSVAMGKIFLSGCFVAYEEENDEEKKIYASNLTFAYEYRNDSWLRLADLPEPLAGSGLAVVNEEIHLVGGASHLSENAIFKEETSTLLRDSYAHYVYADNEWKHLSKLNVARNRLSLVLHDGSL